VSLTIPDHYAILGLDRKCTTEQIRAAYRILAKQFHPDVNGGDAESIRRTQELNAAYELLSDPDRRRSYDDELMRAERRPRSTRVGRAKPIAQDVHLRIEEIFRGTRLDVRVTDPGNPGGPEVYILEIPPDTAPGARFRVQRTDGSTVIVRVKLVPNPRFKVRGSDLRCDLRIPTQRAAQGGTDFVFGPAGSRVRIEIPRSVGAGEVIRVPGEGLPRVRGGRGDLLVRILYRPEVRITRAQRR
jgi:curved DNA-binding protein